MTRVSSASEEDCTAHQCCIQTDEASGGDSTNRKVVQEHSGSGGGISQWERKNGADQLKEEGIGTAGFYHIPPWPECPTWGWLVLC